MAEKKKGSGTLAKGVAAAVLGCICSACGGGTDGAAILGRSGEHHGRSALLAQMKGVDQEVAELAAGNFGGGLLGPADTARFHDSFTDGGSWYDTFADSGG